MAAEAKTAADEEFIQYVAARWQTLVRTAVLLGCGLAEAEDLVQTVLVRCYVSWAKVAVASNRDAYVRTMLVNANREKHRRRRWREVATSSVPETCAPADTSTVEEVDAVRRALAGLTQGQREVIVLRFFTNLSEQEAADALGIASGTVKSRQSRALRILSASDELATYRE